MFGTACVAAEDSNVENIGSIMDKAARVGAAMTEECWAGAGQEPGIEIWRVHNQRTDGDSPDFGIERVPKEEYRQFYRGDSYILLYTYLEGDKLLFNVHFWIGSESSADEYGVAAYKTVELDDLLGGVPVQFREMEGFESELFLSYFRPGGPCPGDLTLLEGGYATGFRHVQVEEYKPRLLWVRKERDGQMISSEKPCALASLNQGDCFILDSGAKLFIYRGESSSPFEKNKAVSVAKNIEQERAGKSTVVDGEEDADFWTLLGASLGDPVPPPIEHGVQSAATGTPSVMELFSLNDDSLEFEKVSMSKRMHAHTHTHTHTHTCMHACMHTYT